MLARLMNPTSGEITIHKGTRVGQVEQVEEESVATLTTTGHVNANSSPEKRQMMWSIVEGTGENLGSAERELFYGLLRV